MHKNGLNQKYVNVRACKGGGTRGLLVPWGATKEQLIELAKQKFLPDGNSMYRSAKGMEFDLMNSQGATIPSMLSDKGKTFPFTLQNYADVTSYSRMRIYLASNDTL